MMTEQRKSDAEGGGRSDEGSPSASLRDELPLHVAAPCQDKRAVRAWMRERLAAVSLAERKRRSARIRERLLSLPVMADSRNVLTCLSFGTEVDTWPLVESLVRDVARTVYVPRCQLGDSGMTIHRYPCELETLSFGLRQPVVAEPALADGEIVRTLDCVCVLGLAFDPQAGHRLGSGRGYFDRFLAKHSVPSVGLAFEQQLVRGLPSDEHDVPMDLIVTECGVYRGRRGTEGAGGDDSRHGQEA